jgi:hypothetical protein
MREEDCQHGALSRSSKRYGRTTRARLERAEDPELQAISAFRGGTVAP